MLFKIFLLYSVECTGLKTEWTSTIRTATTFPVDPGTVVEVTCLYSDAVNKGSSQVTCKADTEFSYDNEPNCEITGMFIILLPTSTLESIQ